MDLANEGAIQQPEKKSVTSGFKGMFMKPAKPEPTTDEWVVVEEAPKNQTLPGADAEDATKLSAAAEAAEDIDAEEVITPTKLSKAQKKRERKKRAENVSESKIHTTCNLATCGRANPTQTCPDCKMVSYCGKKCRKQDKVYI